MIALYAGYPDNYRIRVKVCVKCKAEFKTAEIPRDRLDSLVHAFKRLKETEKARAEDKLQIEVLTNKLKMIAAITNSIP